VCGIRKRGEGTAYWAAIASLPRKSTPRHRKVQTQFSVNIARSRRHRARLPPGVQLAKISGVVMAGPSKCMPNVIP